MKKRKTALYPFRISPGEHFKVCLILFLLSSFIPQVHAIPIFPNNGNDFKNVQQQITGTVVDNAGVPLAGVNVLIEGTTSGTQTDFDGNYTIDATTGDILVFSYIGMKTQSFTVGQSNSIDITMEEDAT